LRSSVIGAPPGCSRPARASRVRRSIVSPSGRPPARDRAHRRAPPALEACWGRDDQFEPHAQVCADRLAIVGRALVLAIVGLRAIAPSRRGKGLWAVIIVFVSMIGPILYFLVGREEDGRPRPDPARSGCRSPPPTMSPPGRRRVELPPPRPPTGSRSDATVASCQG
jgi:hypothetical protein